MRAVKLPIRVPSDHILELRLPENIGEGPAEVIVLVPEADHDIPARPDGYSLEQFLAGSRVDRRFIRSKKEIDDYLRKERESWD